MQRRVNVTIPLACPHCLAELLVTLDDIQQEATLQCDRCGTAIELRPERLPARPMPWPAAEKVFFLIQA
jgi:transcription elongation factor Elf1